MTEENLTWQCPYCGLFTSKRTAQRHVICERMYERGEWEKDYYTTSFATIAMGDEGRNLANH